MFYQRLPLYLKLITLLKLLYRIVHELPKEYKYGLGAVILEKNWELIDLYTEAQNMHGADRNELKAVVISRLSLAFDHFKLRVRFLGELQLISLGQTAELNDRIEEIGKMIGSWHKKV